MVIGLIGAQNSHSVNFLKAINEEKLYPGISIRYIYGGDDPEISERLAEEYELEQCCTEEEAIEKSEAVVVTYRKGSQHFDAVMKALKAGKHVFNDKPFAIKNSDAQDIVDYAREHDLLLCGGSIVKGVSDAKSLAPKIKPGDTIVISFAAEVDSEYDGYYFYGIHCVELCLMLCGLDFLSVSSVQNGSTVISTVSFAENTCVLITSPDNYNLSVTVHNSDGNTLYPISLAGQCVGSDEFVKMLQTGKPPRDYEFYAVAVRLINEIVQSAGL